MIEYKKNYFINNKIKTNKIIYGFFSKKGGRSENYYKSLNCSSSTGDNKQIVERNIKIAIKKLGLKNKTIKFLIQKHTNKIKVVNCKNLNKLMYADGSITKNKNIALAVITADCAPIFIFDSDNSFICSLHVGWKGCLKNIIEKAIYKINNFQNKNKLIAIVGPCLDKNNFEVDKKFKKNFLKKNNNYNKFFSEKPDQKKDYFNMRGLINFQLKACKVRKIFNVKIDTYSNKDLFFSNRRSKHEGDTYTGRMINIIGFR